MNIVLDILIIFNLLVLVKTQVCHLPDFSANSDCSGFWRCANGVSFLIRCPIGLLYNVNSFSCDWPGKVNCPVPKKSKIATNTTIPSTTTTTSITSDTFMASSTTSSTTSSDTSTSLLTSTTTQNSNSNSNATNHKVLSNASKEKTAICTWNEFVNAVTINGYPEPTLEQYANLISQATSIGGINTKHHLAVFLAQILHESGGLTQLNEEACYPEIQNTNCAYYTGLGDPDKNYYGRGYIQLSWDYNYKAASYDLFGSDLLLTDPDQVALNETVAWATSFWYWKTNVLGGAFAEKILHGQFGAATNAINGAIECTGPYHSVAKHRYKIYKNILSAFKINKKPNKHGCYN